jgi:outer membrane biosynthesis protein TonB
MACSKRVENKVSPSAVASASTSDPEFDKKWAALAQAGADVAYIEDDRGEGLMGNVRRASRVKAEAPVLAAPAGDQVLAALPEQPAGEEVQRIIRGNLMAVRGCYMNMARTGQAKSGKAIVSFTIGADGRPASLHVDAPTFSDTPLPGCVTAQISRWSFPKSQKGGGSVSYPFVFVGG